MRVFLCGAQGVGKSTLVNKITELERKDSFSKKFLEEDPSIQTSKSDRYNEFQDKILLYCLSEYINSKDFIASRSIIDSFAYLSANKSDNKIPLINLLNHYRDYLLTSSDIYVYLPIEFEISKDGNKSRETDSDYQREVDIQIRKYFSIMANLKTEATFVTVSGSIEERRVQLEKIIKQVKEKKNV